MVEGGKLRVQRLLVAANVLLIAVDVLGEIPVSIVALVEEAVGVNCGMNGPGMNFGQRKILVHDANFIFVLGKDFGEQS